MSQSRRAAVVLAVAWLSTGVAACKDATSHPPPAPTLPAGWTVKEDKEIPRDRIVDLERRLDGKIVALRNTQYEVHGKSVQLNTVQAASPADAEKIIVALGKTKPAYAVARRGEVVYEFVGGNESTADITAARDALSK